MTDTPLPKLIGYQMNKLAKDKFRLIIASMSDDNIKFCDYDKVIARETAIAESLKRIENCLYAHTQEYAMVRKLREELEAKR